MSGGRQVYCKYTPSWSRNTVSSRTKVSMLFHRFRGWRRVIMVELLLFSQPERPVTMVSLPCSPTHSKQPAL
ncbi:hypothetical protein NEIPOLOT_02413 [Neisseria polysaccharea ATCC 43768]|nr:hypothetical protein NEIPOLOT_02413 [Neisseria polysaccharea ATCC 43768]